MRLLAKIGMQLDVLDDAEFLLEGVLMIVPNYHAARYEYATRAAQAAQARARPRGDGDLLKADPDNRVYRTTHATICTGFGDYRASAAALPRAPAPRRRDDSELHLSIAHALKTLGRAQEAIESYRAAAAARPNFGEAYWSLANLKTYRFTDDRDRPHARRRSGAERSGSQDRYHLCFALGKALEDRSDYADHLPTMSAATALKKTECRYRPEITERNTRLQAEVCTRGILCRPRRAWVRQRRPTRSSSSVCRARARR